MKTPHFISYKEWRSRVTKFFSRNAFLVSEEDKYYCAHCNSLLRGLHTYISEHDSMWSTCAGSGQVRRILVPYCPNCESEPEEHGCLHDTW